MSIKDPKNQKLLNDFIAEHAPLVHKQINILKSKGKIPSNVELEDLHYHGIHGLIDALHRYKPNATTGEDTDKHAQFSKYAEQRIRGKMLDHIASQGEIPKHLRRRAKNLELLEQQKKSSIPAETTTQPKPDKE